MLAKIKPNYNKIQTNAHLKAEKKLNPCTHLLWFLQQGVPDGSLSY